MTAPQVIAQVTARQKVANRRAIFKSILGNPRALSLTHRQYNLMRQLLLWINPATGHLRYATMNCTLERELRVSTSTLARARRELIEMGLIIGYRPGDGRVPGRYTLARSWAEADAQAAERKRAGGRPYFPPIPDRTAQAQQAAQASPEPKPQEQAPAAPRPRRSAGPALTPDRLPQSQPYAASYGEELAARAADPSAAPDNPARLAAMAAAREAIKRPRDRSADPPAA